MGLFPGLLCVRQGKRKSLVILEALLGKNKKHGKEGQASALSGVLSRDLRQYSCDTPYSAIGTRPQLELRY